MTVDRRLAMHEAGHAVIAHHLGLKIEEIVMNPNLSYVQIEDVPDTMKWECLLFSTVPNALELKLDPVNGWLNISDHDFRSAVELVDEGTMGWHPPGLANDDEDGVGKTEEYIDSFTGPVMDSLEQQAALIIDIPEIWQQINRLADILLTVDRLSGDEVLRLLEASA
jgi:hypothetical protein